MTIGPLNTNTHIRTDNIDTTSNDTGKLAQSGGLFSSIKSIVNTAIRESAVLLKTASKTASEKISNLAQSIKNVFSNMMPFRSSEPGVMTASHTTDTVATEKTAPLTDAQKTLATDNMNALMSDMRNTMNNSNDIEGVFRKAANEKNIKNIDMQTLTAEKLGELSLHDKATLMKRHLDTLTNPKDGQPALLSSQDVMEMLKPDADVAGILKDKIGALSDHYRKDNIKNIIDFIVDLPNRVPDFIDRSKMNNANLAIVTAPKLLPEDLKTDMGAIQGITSAFAKVLDSWPASTQV